MDFEFPHSALLHGELELELAGPAAGGLPDGGALLDGGSEGEFVGSALEWDDRELQDLLHDDPLAASPAAAGSMCTDGVAPGAEPRDRFRRYRQKIRVQTEALPDVAGDQVVSERRAIRAARQRVYRERLKDAKSQLPAELEAAEHAVAALRAENAALEERVAALTLVGEYTGEMAAVAMLAAEQHARQAPAGAPSGGGRLSLLAGAVFRSLPPSACKALMSNVPSATQARFFAEHATVDQFRAVTQMRATWVNQLAQQCIEGDEAAESRLEAAFALQKIIVRTVMQHRVDVMSEMAKTRLPGAALLVGPHATGADRAGGVAGVNPALLPLRHQVALTPCQRAQLMPHWRSFLSESRVLRQEMRATLVRVCAAPEALIATYQAAQTSAETLLSATEATAALRDNHDAQLRMTASLVLALFTLLSTKQTAFVLLATQLHTLDPEQICKVLLGGDDDEGLPGGGDRGHVLAELATSGA